MMEESNKSKIDSTVDDILKNCSSLNKDFQLKTEFMKINDPSQSVKSSINMSDVDQILKQYATTNIEHNKIDLMQGSIGTKSINLSNYASESLKAAESLIESITNKNMSISQSLENKDFQLNKDILKHKEIANEEVNEEVKEIANEEVKEEVNEEVKEEAKSEEPKETIPIKESKEEIKNKESEEEKKENEAIIPMKKHNLQDPISFVNFVELEHAKTQTTEIHAFTLQNLKETTKRCNVLQLDTLKELSEQVFKKEGLIHALGVSGDYFITGNNAGKIIIYSISNKRELATLTDKNIIPSSVNCFDISEDRKQLLAGYASGLIVLWELQSQKCIKIMETIHESSCMAVKMFNKEAKSFEILSSDIQGNLILTLFKDIFFTYSITSEPLIKREKNPFFIINIMTFDSVLTTTYPHLCSFPLTAIIGNMNSIRLIPLLESSESVFYLEKPPNIVEYHLPDVGYGIGRLPTSGENFELLLTISWGNLIYVYKAIMQRNNWNSFEQIGYYINSSIILRIGFISPSVIYIFDSQKYIKVINTKDVIKGQYIYNKEASKKESEEGRLVDMNVKYQTLFNDPKKNPKALYTNLIIENNNTVYLFGDKTIYYIRLLNWEKCLTNLQENNDWINLILFGIDIYHAKLSALADIPHNENNRRSTIGKFLREIINQYVVYCLGGHETKNKQDQVSECAEIVIEFCIEIESVDYLLDTIQNIFESKNYGNIFLSKLEPFILCDKIAKINLSEKIIEGLLDIYRQKNQLDILENLLVHLNINSINNEKLKEKCAQLGLINPLIFISMNGKNEDFFSPIIKMYEMYKKTSLGLKLYPTIYDDLINNKRLNELKTSKQYCGYKLLWYINWCIRGVKFPSQRPMKTDSYRIFILKVTYWMLESKIFYELLGCEHKFFFIILNTIFTNPVTLTFLEDSFGPGDSEDKIKAIANLNNEAFQDFNLSIPQLISLIAIHIKAKYTSEYMPYLYEFIVSVINEDYMIDKDLAVEAITFLLAADVRNKSPNEMIKISDDIIKLFRIYINTFDYDIFSSMYINEVYEEIKIYLLQKRKDYRRCLDLFLDDQSKIPDKESKMFHWINKELAFLQMGNISGFANFKQILKEYLPRLGLAAHEKMIKMIQNWFDEDSKYIISLLETEPEIQLEYVEDLIQKTQISEELLSNLTEAEKIQKLLHLHIELLCRVGKKDAVLSALSKNSFYPIAECLKTCLKYKAYKPSIYLYQQNGCHMEAINLCFSRLDAVFAKIREKIKAHDIKENTYNPDFNEFNNLLNDATDICCKNDKTNSSDIWLFLLDKVYDLYRLTVDLKKRITPTSKVIPILERFQTILTDYVKTYLGIVCNYVSILQVIGYVTKNSTAEFKEMKDTLTQIINDYTHQLNILGSAKELLSVCVLKQVRDYLFKNTKGLKYNLKQCDYCKESLGDNPATEILTFGCGHKVHATCSEEQKGIKICYICLRYELEQNETVFEKPDSTENNQQLSQSKKIVKPSNVMFRKLKLYDKKYTERLKIIIDDTLREC